MNDVKGQLRALFKDGQWAGTGRNAGHVLRAAPELTALLAGLLDGGATMTILSLFRYGNGPHGKPEPDGSAVGHAVDIAAYNSAAIHLKIPANAVREPARSALTQAVDGNPVAKIQFLYPDGVDHLHVTTIA